MKKQISVLAVAAAIFLTGCVVTSLHPYYTSKEVIFEPGLVGSWTNTQQSDEHWTFQKEKNSYHLTCVSGGKTNLIQVYLFKLSGQMFLDFATLDLDCDVMPPPIPSHLLLRVFQLSPSVRMALLNNDWLKALLEKNPKTIHHEMIGDKPDDRRVVFTADTAELQQFLAKQLNTDEAWQDSFELKRD